MTITRPQRHQDSRRRGARQPGRVLPLPIIQTAQAIKDLTSGQTLLVKASDPGFEPDIKAWANRTGNALLSGQQQGDECTR